MRYISGFVGSFCSALLFCDKALTGEKPLRKFLFSDFSENLKDVIILACLDEVQKSRARAYVLAVGAGGVVWTLFSLVYLLFLPLWGTDRYRLNTVSKQQTNQPIQKSLCIIPGVGFGVHIYVKFFIICLYFPNRVTDLVHIWQYNRYRSNISCHGL